MAARAHTNLALPLGTGQVLIASELGGFDFALIVRDHPGARGETEPLVVGAAGNRRDTLAEHGRFQRRENAGLLGAP